MLKTFGGRRAWLAAALSAVLAACGGGGSDEAAPPPSSASGPASTPSSPSGSASAPAAPSVSLSLTTTAVTLDVDGVASPQATIAGTWSATAGVTTPVYIQVDDPSARFSAPAPAPATGTSFSIVVTARDTLADGSYAGALKVRACQDAACATPWPGAEQFANYLLRVAMPAEWSTFQGNAKHDGYVPVTLDPAKFELAWRWQRETSSEPIGGINAPVAAGSRVYVTRDVYFGEGVLYALDAATGAETWRRSMGDVPAMSPPAVSAGRVYFSITGHDDTFLYAFDAAAGTFQFKSAYGAQWPHFLAPTVFGGRVYNGTGYYGGTFDAWSAATGDRLWSATVGGAWDMYTPAADAGGVYHHNGEALSIVSPSNGAVVATIADPLGSSSAYSYHGAPVIGGRQNVLAFAKGAFSGRASSNVEQYESRVISSFDIAARRYEWSTGHAYMTAPAVAGGVIYAGRNDEPAFDAIDERTGATLWSWVPTLADGDASFHRNVVATDNLVFVSTDRAVYAIDKATRKPVWRYGHPGALTLTRNHLFIATGATESDGALHAIRVR